MDQKKLDDTIHKIKITMVTLDRRDQKIPSVAEPLARAQSDLNAVRRSVERAADDDQLDELMRIADVLRVARSTIDECEEDLRSVVSQLGAGASAGEPPFTWDTPGCEPPFTWDIPGCVLDVDGDQLPENLQGYSRAKWLIRAVAHEFDMAAAIECGGTPADAAEHRAEARRLIRLLEED